MLRKLLAGFMLAALAVPAASRAAVATTSFSAGAEGPHPRTIQIAPADGGGHLLTVKLAGLPRGARVYRARLRAWRGEVKDPAALMTAIEIYPGAKAAGKPLALVGPGYDAFDATAAVGRALKGAGELKLFVKAFPAFQPERTRLEVSYEGKPVTVPSPVTGLKVFHRAGATFITWKEVAPLITADKATWGEFKKALAEAKEPFAYRVYAHDRPIDAASIARAALLAEVGPLSVWNVNGRNMEYLIGQAMIKSDKIGELAAGYNSAMYRWGPNHPRMDRYPLDRLVIDERAGPLPPGTGLYVHHPPSRRKRCYAVVSCRGGVENTADFGPGNSLAKPVDETVGPGEPVRQGKGLWGPFFDYPGTRWVYVQWCAPPLAPRPGMYFNWSVLVPPNLKKDRKAPVELYLHKGNFSYAKPRQKFMLNSIQIAPHDWPASGWYGYNDAFGTLKSFKSGTVSNHTQQRIIAFLTWAGKAFPLDAERLLLPGSDGAALLALNYPDMFAYVLINKFGTVVERSPQQLVGAWGPKSPDIKDSPGRGNWGWAMLDEVVLARRKHDLPLIFCRGYSWGPFIRGFARGQGRFYSAMRKANQPVVADWTWASGQLVRPNKYTGLWRGTDITRSTPMPAFANCSLDSNKEGNGQTNLQLGWRPIKDTPGGVEAVISSHREATFDLAFRRLRKFKVAPGQKLRWEAVSAPDPRSRTKPPPPQSGTVVVDADGVFVLKGLKTAGRGALTVKVARAG